jgi:hypothetical protein
MQQLRRKSKHESSEKRRREDALKLLKKWSAESVIRKSGSKSNSKDAENSLPWKKLLAQLSKRRVNENLVRI